MSNLITFILMWQDSLQYSKQMVRWNKLWDTGSRVAADGTVGRWENKQCNWKSEHTMTNSRHSTSWSNTQYNKISNL